MGHRSQVEERTVEDQDQHVVDMDTANDELSPTDDPPEEEGPVPDAAGGQAVLGRAPLIGVQAPEAVVDAAEENEATETSEEEESADEEPSHDPVQMMQALMQMSNNTMGMSIAINQDASRAILDLQDRVRLLQADLGNANVRTLICYQERDKAVKERKEARQERREARQELKREKNTVLVLLECQKDNSAMSHRAFHRHRDAIVQWRLCHQLLKEKKIELPLELKDPPAVFVWPRKRERSPTVGGVEVPPPVGMPKAWSQGPEGSVPK